MTDGLTICLSDREALESERAQAGFLRQQLQSTSASLDHEKQRAAQVQQQLQQVHDATCCPSYTLEFM